MRHLSQQTDTDEITALRARVKELEGALADTIGRFEYASNMFHNVEHWHGEQSPMNGLDYYEWFMQPSRQALKGDKS